MTKHSRGLVVLTSLALALCPPAACLSTPIGPITAIVVEHNGIGPEAEDCSAFSVRPDQVRSFFESAVLISGRQHHDFFLRGPCAARGTLESRYDKWQWEIRSMGTGTITATNGDTFLLGDPRQESSLADDRLGP
jgi:hypothetical protein